MPFPEGSMVDEGWDPTTTQLVHVASAVDGCGSLRAAVSSLRQLADHLERLEGEGWHLDGPFQDGEAVASRRPAGSAVGRR